MNAWEIMLEVWPQRRDIASVKGPSAYPDVIPGAEAYLAWVASLPVRDKP